MFKHQNQLYNIIELTRMQSYPFRTAAYQALKMMNSAQNPLFDKFPGSIARAYLTLTERLTRVFEKPSFNIDSTVVDGKEYPVSIEQEIILPFCNLIHFEKRDCKAKLPKMLIVPPMAGHHATLLHNTVEELLPFFDIYLTEWADASRVPVSEGSFDMDDFIDYTIKFITHFKERVHVLAVCQPGVPVLAAAAIMSDQKMKPLPASLTIIGGPLDARKNPTIPDEFATHNSIKWFEDHVIMRVPDNYPGAGRKVYPGFLQLSSFVSLNFTRHVHSYCDLFKDIVNNDKDAVEKHTKFYDEYLASMDLPAEFYLQTIREVFQNFSLAKGTMKSRGRKVDLKAITDIALLGIEGEKDDITAVGQTLAGLDLCTNLPASKKKYHLQLGVGHYGIFSGSKFKECIAPMIRSFAYTQSNFK